MPDESSQKRRSSASDNIFVIATLERHAENSALGKKDAAAAEKNRLEKIEKEISRAVEDAVEKSG